VIASSGGTEWVVDAFGCEPARLRDPVRLRGLLDRIVAELELRVVGDGLVHQFPEPGGVTAIYLLTESHLACHTYPETGLATFNLYCCRARAPWPWPERLAEVLRAARVEVRVLPRGGGAGGDAGRSAP
jgi:S-adenosylmethionine decarboxylase